MIGMKGSNAGKKRAARALPALAIDLQLLLDLLSQFLVILDQLSELFGLNFGGND